MPYGGQINLINTRLMATNSNVRIKFKKRSDTAAKERKRRLEFQTAQILNQSKLGANMGKEGVDKIGLHMSCRTKSTKEEKCYEENRGIQRYRFFMYNIPTNLRHERISDFLYHSILRFAHSSFDLRLFHQPADNPKYSSKFLGFALVDVKFWAKNKERWLNFPRYLEENIAGKSLVTGKFAKPSCFPDHDFSVIKKYLREQVNTKIKDPSKHLHLSVGAVGPLVKKGYHISRLRLVTKPPDENELKLLQELEVKPHLFYKNEAEKTTMEIQKFLNHRNEDGVMENLESKINEVEEGPEMENKLRKFIETDKDIRFENRCVFTGLSPGCGHNQITIEIFRLTGVRLKKCYAFSNPTNWRKHLSCGYVETLTKKDCDKLLFLRSWFWGSEF